MRRILSVQFVPLPTTEMRHKNISYDSYNVLYSLERREMRHHTRNVNQTQVKLANNKSSQNCSVPSNHTRSFWTILNQYGLNQNAALQNSSSPLPAPPRHVPGHRSLFSCCYSGFCLYWQLRWWRLLDWKEQKDNNGNYSSTIINSCGLRRICFSVNL